VFLINLLSFEITRPFDARWILDSVNDNHTFVTEAGDVEDWGGMNKETREKILKDLKEFTTTMRKHIS